MGTQRNAPLPDGLEIGGYRITRKIASGGFSIVYLADDPDGQPVAIKEYLPSSLVKRLPGELVPRIASDHLITYQNGLKCFFEEGRALANVFHPNVVRVLNFFRANDTVYMVMAFEHGRTLQDLIVKNRGKAGQPVIAERHIRAVFFEVINGLREVHANRMLHLDLKPANVYLRRNASPMLLDFGAARKTLTDNAPRLFPMYTPGFAAPELYRRHQQLGPWTDLYGLGATLYACMVGSPPQPADQRSLHDKVDAALHGASRIYSQALCDMVHWCLKLNPMERPQSLFVLQKWLKAPYEQAREASSSGGLAAILRLRRRRSAAAHSTLIWSTIRAAD